MTKNQQQNHFFTVGSLIKILQALPPEMPIGRRGPLNIFLPLEATRVQPVPARVFNPLTQEYDEEQTILEIAMPHVP